MIAVFSTSCPWASVALFSTTGELLASHKRLAPRAGGHACCEMLETLLSEVESELSKITLFVADGGPGSFTGCKTAVTLAKTFAFANKTECALVTAFDLIDPAGPAAIPSRKTEALLRLPGEEPSVVPVDQAMAAKGYGHDRSDEVFPLAENAGPLIPSLKRVSAHELLPYYVLEPSISKPKRPLIMGSSDA
jgi:hypothetical protein